MSGRLWAALVLVAAFGGAACSEQGDVPPPPRAFSSEDREIWVSAHRGEASAQRQVGLHYFNDTAGARAEGIQLGGRQRNAPGAPRNRTEAVRWFQLAADQGDETASRYLGYAYAFGEGVEADVARAQELWGGEFPPRPDVIPENQHDVWVSAHNGDSRAAYILSRAYKDSDICESLNWLERSAQAESSSSDETPVPHAALHMGIIYSQEIWRNNFRSIISVRGLDAYDDCSYRYSRVALGWFDRSANNGNPDAQTQMAFIYAYGPSVDGSLSVNYSEAVRRYDEVIRNRRSDDRRRRDAHYAIGTLYERGGPRLEQNHEEAARYYALAARGGHTRAELALRRLQAEGS